MPMDMVLLSPYGGSVFISAWGSIVARSDCNGQFLRPHRVERVTGTGSTSFLFMYHTNTKILLLTVIESVTLNT